MKTAASRARKHKKYRTVVCLAHALVATSVARWDRLNASLEMRVVSGHALSIDRKGSHDFQQMSSVQAKSFRGRRAIALGGSEGAND